MNTVFSVNTQLDVPIYQQLVDTISAAVRKGTLLPGAQLPTVQEMTAELGIARGTVKRAYDELERAGLIEKVQGRGTFVRYQPANSGSRKERAMAAIDEMLDQLEDMGLSASEINIFLNLKRFDVPPTLGGVNRIAPLNEWGGYIVKNTQEALGVFFG